MKKSLRREKLSEKDTKELCDEYISGITSTVLAKKYGVCQRTVLNILIRNKIDRRDISVCHQIYEIDQNFFEKIDTQEKAYILGILYADGNNYRVKNTICLTLKHNDIELLKCIKNILKSTRPLEYIPSKSFINKTIAPKSDSQYALKICNKKISQDLEKLGCVNAKSLILEFPKYDQVPHHLMSHFIRGYFDGDGCFTCYKTGFISGSSAFKITSSLTFLYELKKFFEENLNLYSFIESHTIKLGKKYSTLVISGNKKVMKIMDWIYNDANLFLLRKRLKYEKFLYNYFNNNTRIIKNNRNKSIMIDIKNGLTIDELCKKYKISNRWLKTIIEKESLKALI